MPHEEPGCLELTSSSPRESGFIGWQLELAVLTAALDTALAGRGRLVMLAGEPGIGKTRIAQEIARQGQDRGAQLLGPMSFCCRRLPFLQISTDLGMMSQVGEAPAPAYPGGLTGREVEVLRLISSGMTDREIGEELFISVKTVGNHVGNILNNTGAANRAEAASYAALHGIVTDDEAG